MAELRVIHEPCCNTYCRPGGHYLTDGIGYPHLHRTDLSPACGECTTPPAPESATDPSACVEGGGGL